MRAAKMKERPTFQLMCQTDVQSIYHMQMPRWLFSDPRYCEMSLDAKVTYTFLLNRFQLSRKNGWVNDRGEVFVIFPRKALAKELRICEQRVTAAFKKEFKYLRVRQLHALVQPGFYSKDGLHEPFLLRFTGNGKGAGYLFSVAWLDAATHIATVPRMKGERIIWISESGSFGEIDLPRHHFFAARQKDGTHRFFGSNEPEKI